MLDGAFTSPKIRRLAAILEIPWPHALGLAGLLWRFAAKHAADGEVGRHDDEEIATALEWPGAAESLVEAFVRVRMLDEHERPARLLIHDWPDHAPRYVASGLRRRNRDFSPLYSTSDPLVIASVTRPSSTSSHTPAYASASSSPSSEETEGDRDLEERLIAIWSLWVAGRKTGKSKALESMRVSIRRLRAGGLTPDAALRRIESGTFRDAEAFRRDVAQGRLELQYVPIGSTYFSQERWLDDEDAPEPERNPDEAIRDEIDRLRSD